MPKPSREAKTRSQAASDLEDMLGSLRTNMDKRGVDTSSKVHVHCIQCMYVYMYVCVHVHVCMCTCTCMYVYMYSVCLLHYGNLL